MKRHISWLQSGSSSNEHSKWKRRVTFLFLSYSCRLISHFICNQQRRRREREELWVEFGCEEKEEQEEKRKAQEEQMTQAQRLERQRDMAEQLIQLDRKKEAEKLEEQYERLWVTQQLFLLIPCF